LAEPKEVSIQAETELHAAGPRASLDVCGGEIVVVEGPDRGQRLSLGPLPVRVGTALGSQLRLTDRTVSRLHVQLTPRRDSVRLVDAGSTNGTFVDGIRAHDVELSGGASIRVGATVLRLEMGSEPGHVALSQRTRFGSLLGASVEMRRLYAVLELAAPTHATVLIQGETGTGKELVAREIHAHSTRAKGPFVVVDCSSIAPNVIESELFGHTRGAFTDAKSDRAGLIEAAHGGTLFLDEIGELPLALQAKLLRALETREVRRVGANVARSVDVRIVAATHRPLAQGVNTGSFREDLYYRLAVVEVVLPPLRARREDVPLLAGQFFKQLGGPGRLVPPELLTHLIARSWPGNVRELRNFVERCCALGGPQGESSMNGAPHGLGSAPEASPDAHVTTVLPVNLGAPLKKAREEVLARLERLYVESALRRADGNVTRAAEAAGVSRRFLQRLIARLGIRGAIVDAPDGDPRDDPDDPGDDDRDDDRT